MSKETFAIARHRFAKASLKEAAEQLLAAHDQYRIGKDGINVPTGEVLRAMRLIEDAKRIILTTTDDGDDEIPF